MGFVHGTLGEMNESLMIDQRFLRLLNLNLYTQKNSESPIYFCLIELYLISLL